MTTALTASIRYLPRWVRCHATPAEIAEVRGRIEQLSDAVGGRLNLAGLDAVPLRETRRNRWWRLKVPPFRVFFLPAGDEIIVAELDRRDEHTYDDLSRLDHYLLVRAGEGLRVVAHEAEESQTHSRPRGRETTPAARREQQNPLSPFDDAQLEALGLETVVIRRLRTFGPGIDVAEELAELDLDPEVIEVVAAAWHDPARMLAIFDEGRVPTPDELTLNEDELARRAASPDSGTSLAALDDAALQAILAGTVEEWMFYLHPSQLRIVEAEPTGPARIRGGPGTGKTVAALHRARWLARTGWADRVLVTTFVAVLPRVWEALYQAFAPDVRGKITTATVDSLAWHLVDDAGGVTVTVQDAERRKLLDEALAEIPAAKDALAVGPEGLGAEIDFVIAGRCLDEEGYLRAARRGRRRALSATQRRSVYAAYQVYLRLLGRGHKTDWAHLRLEALRLARAGEGPRFDAIIVDEAQDLTESHLDLLLALNDDPDRRALLLVGDGQQAIYPGGFTLRSVGLDVRGRSHLLHTNWRNTQLIAAASETVMLGVPFGDLEEATSELAAEASLPRRLGEPPVLHCLPRGGIESVLPLVVEDLLSRHQPSDIAVLSPTNKLVNEAEQALRPHETLNLSRYEGGTVEVIRVGTYARSKGLEFKAVIVTDPTAYAIRMATWMHDDEDDLAEAVAQWTRTLFVAMTRARDELILVASGRLADSLEAARTEFEVEVW